MVKLFWQQLKKQNNFPKCQTLPLSKRCVCVSFISSSEEVTRWLVVLCELAGAVAGHADPHETQQDSHARHHRGFPVLQHSLGCLSLKERTGVTTYVPLTTNTDFNQCDSSVPPDPGHTPVSTNLHFCQVSTHIRTACVWRHLRNLSQSKSCLEVRHSFSYVISLLLSSVVFKQTQATL